MENKKGKTKFLKIFASVSLIVGALIIIIIRVNNPDFPIGVVIISIVVAIISSILIFGSTSILKMFSKKKDITSKLPLPISTNSAKLIAIELLKSEDYLEYPDRYSTNKFDGSVEVGKPGRTSRVYILDCTGKFSRRNFVIIINQHYPFEKFVVLVDPSPMRVDSIKNIVASFPSEEPDIETTTEESPLTGIKRTIQKVTHKAKEDKKEEEEKEL